MKYQIILTFALASFGLLTTTPLLAADNTSAKEEVQARWFEIEIILFNQISTKNKNKTNEAYTSRDLTSKKRYALDLLSPYLQPNISSLKQLLPECGQPISHFPFNVKTTPINLLSIDPDSDSESMLVNIASQTDVEKKTNENLNKSSINSSDNNSNKYSVAELAKNQVKLEQDKNQLSTAIIQDNTSRWSTINVPVYNDYPSDKKYPLCIIPTKILEQNLNAEQLAQFDPDSFPIKKSPQTINGIEQWQDNENGEITWASKKPYLISQDSLRLKSINNRIKRSRDYSPLLHLGWRQIAETNKRKAQAVNLYAGENLNLSYQQALIAQKIKEQEIELHTILEKREQIQAITNKPVLEAVGVNSMEINPLLNDELSLKQELRLQAKTLKLETLFQQFDFLNESLNKGMNDGASESESLNENSPNINKEQLNTIVAQLSSDLSTQADLSIDSMNPLEKQKNITKPIQPWYLDGLFKIHLDHYLFINSEFNIVEVGSLLNASNNNARQDKEIPPKKVISFKQDRRVITGEVHYFDHPHIGMIVQIRRFDPSKPAAEAVSQSKK